MFKQKKEKKKNMATSNYFLSNAYCIGYFLVQIASRYITVGML